MECKKTLNNFNIKINFVFQIFNQNTGYPKQFDKKFVTMGNAKLIWLFI